MSLLTSLLLLIVLSRLFGELLSRLGQPAIVGEMLAGVLLGPSLLNLIHPNSELAAISELAVFLVVLSSGLEMNFSDVMSAFRGRGLVIAAFSFFIPFLMGVATGKFFHFDVMRTVFLGLTIAITALPVAVRILESFKQLQSTIAKYTIASAIVSDIISLLALGIILDLPDQRTFQAVAVSLGATTGKLAILAALIMGFNWAVHRIERSGFRINGIPEYLIKVFGHEALFGIVVTFVLVFSSISSGLGFHHVIGAFFGALLIDKTFFLASHYKDLEKTIGSISNGFLAPIFFAYLGLQFSPTEMQSASFVIVALIVSILSKIIAGYLGGRLTGVNGRDSLGIGILSNARGVMGLVISSIAYENHFIGQALFSTLVLMSIVTTVITPMLLRRFTFRTA